MREHKGLWYPEGDSLTKNFIARLETEAFYRADRFHDAMKHVRAWRGAVDCGAHVGAWSREMAKRFERVVAIEMNPATSECLERNLVPWPNAVPVNHALGDRGGKIKLFGNKGSIDSEVEGDGDDVWLDRLDDLSAVKDLSAVDYLKVHVNGYELEVLKGAQETIRKHRPVMTVVIKKALANYGATEQDVLDFMERMGYAVASRLKPYWVFAPR